MRTGNRTSGHSRICARAGTLAGRGLLLGIHLPDPISRIRAGYAFPPAEGERPFDGHSPVTERIHPVTEQELAGLLGVLRIGTCTLPTGRKTQLQGRLPARYPIA